MIFEFTIRRNRRRSPRARRKVRGFKARKRKDLEASKCVLHIAAKAVEELVTGGSRAVVKVVSKRRAAPRDSRRKNSSSSSSRTNRTSHTKCSNNTRRTAAVVQANRDANTVRERSRPRIS